MVDTAVNENNVFGLVKILVKIVLAQDHHLRHQVSANERQGRIIQTNSERGENLRGKKGKI